MLEAVRSVWEWWRRQLLDLVPGLAARRLTRAEDGVILAPLGDGMADVMERDHGAVGPVLRLRLEEAAERARQSAQRRSWPVVLRLPADMLLEREVSLPLAAERDPRQVLFHEMDRFTPFAASEIYWSHAVLGRDRARNRLAMRLSLVPRAMVDPARTALAQAGIAPTELELPAADGSMRRIGLEGGLYARRRDWRGTALAGCAVLALLAMVLPFVMQGRAQDAAEARIAALQPTVTRVQALRRAVAASSTGTQAVAEEHKRAGDVLEGVALLTDALPDDTYLTALTYDTGRVTVDGQSKAAAALIAPLTANGRLQDVSFTAPVIRNTLGNDAFSLRLRVTH